MNDAWPFADPPNLAVVTMRSIIEDGRPILLVVHHADDSGWQFLDGEDVTEEDARVVSSYDAISRDASLRNLVISLPTGWQAWRSGPDQAWQTLPL